MTLARIVEAMPQRRPSEVILATLHAADVLFQWSMEEVGEWRTATVEERVLVIEAIERAQRFAREVITTAAYERQAAAEERLDTALGELVVSALNAIFADLELDERQRALLPTVVPARMREITAS